MHNFERNISNYWDTVTFWEKLIYSDEILIFDLPENYENHYICIFNYYEVNHNYYSYVYYSIRKFKFDSFNNYIIINKVDYENIIDCVTISGFVVYDSQIIVIFFLKLIRNNFNNKAQYFLGFYNYNLINKNEISKEFLSDSDNSGYTFFRCFLIKERLAAFLYFLDNPENSYKFEIGELSNYPNNPSFQYRISNSIPNGNLLTSKIAFNDFLKLMIKDSHLSHHILIIKI